MAENNTQQVEATHAGVSRSELVRTVAPDRTSFNTLEHLEHARIQAVERGLHELLVVDSDAHHYELEDWPEIVKYIEDPVLRDVASSRPFASSPGAMVNSTPTNQQMSGRLTRYPGRETEEVEPDVPRDVTLIRREMASIGIDYQIVFPTPMLELGLHPDPDMETSLSWAYTRWLTEQVLPHDPMIKTMVMLPFHDPDACEKVIERFTDSAGVVGFMVTTARHGKPVHDNQYMRIYSMLEERGLPLGFHAVYNRHDRSFEGMNRFLSLHALGFVMPNMVNLTNMIINGIPERFPALKVIWIESGLAWLPFMAQRLDNEYLMRRSEAPLLKKLPSEYIHDNFYYTTQPIETNNLDALKVTFDIINADNRLLFASDYPHWDFNLPSTIYDLPFLDLDAKKKILGGNAQDVFRLDGHAA